MKSKLMIMVLALGFVAYGCGSSSSNDDDDDLDPIVGVWVSEGNNVAPGLAGAPFNTAKIDAEFEENGTYHVVSTDTQGAEVTFTGSFVAGEPNSAGIRSITLNQSTPVALTSSGIFRVVDNQMEYEVIQTDPPLEGVLAPTVEGGFGSTNIFGNATGPFWIQTYVRTTAN